MATKQEIQREIEFTDWWFKEHHKAPTYADAIAWADKSMMERVMTFFNTYFYDHPHVNCHVCTDSFESLEEMEEELIKAMEEWLWQ